MKKLLLLIPIMFILVACGKSTDAVNVEEATKVLETTAVEETTMAEKVTDQLESTTVVVVETTQPETTKIVEEPKSKVEVNIGGAEVEFTEEELKEPEIDFAKLQEELDRQAQAEAQAQAIAQQQAQQAAQQAAQAQAKQGTDKNGHPYLAPGAQYTWGANGPIEAPPNGQKVVIQNPNTGESWGYSSLGEWLNIDEGNRQHEASMEKERKQFEGTRKLTHEEAEQAAELFIRGMRGD